MQRRLDRMRSARHLRYFSPPGMVAAATERRLAGDWRGACAAALVDVHLDLREVAAAYGPGEAERIEADLTGLAPELLRRFLPRTAGQALWSRDPVVLTRLDHPERLADGRHRPLLVAKAPRTVLRGRQSVDLRVSDFRALPARWHDFPAWTWHADAVTARRWAYGASADRLPWHDTDGTPQPQGTPPGRGEDRAAELERLTAGTAVAGFEAAGFAVDLFPPASTHYTPEQLLAPVTRMLPLLREETTRLARRYRQSRLTSPDQQFDITDAAGARPSVRNHDWRHSSGGPFVLSLEAPPDATLLRFGDLHPDELHPLVHEALFPDRRQHWRPPAEPPVPSIRVRCGGQWHEVVPVCGYLTTPHHTDQEIDDELLPGGPIGGCAAAVRGWLTGQRPVPKPVRKRRQDLFALALHGDTDTLLARLAGGVDPRLRGPGGGTLLHWMANLDHTRMLPLLLDAGLSLEDRDHEGRTPLHQAALSQDGDTVAALLAVRANPMARDNAGRTPAELLAYFRQGAWL